MLDLTAPAARRLYVSAIAEDGATGLPLEEFLNRVTPGSTITWKSGPTGDYLALFQGMPGTNLPLPNLRSRGMWLIDWISGGAASTSAPQRLSGSIRKKLIRTGDELTTDQPVELIWSPGDPVQISLHDNNLLGDDTLLRVQGTGFYAATALLRQHKIEDVDGIDPNLSHLEIYLDVEHEGRRVALRGERQSSWHSTSTVASSWGNCSRPTRR